MKNALENQLIELIEIQNYYELKLMRLESIESAASSDELYEILKSIEKCRNNILNLDKKIDSLAIKFKNSEDFPND